MKVKTFKEFLVIVVIILKIIMIVKELMGFNPLGFSLKKIKVKNGNFKYNFGYSGYNNFNTLFKRYTKNR